MTKQVFILRKWKLNKSGHDQFTSDCLSDTLQSFQKLLQYKLQLCIKETQKCLCRCLQQQLASHTRKLLIYLDMIPGIISFKSLHFPITHCLFVEKKTKKTLINILWTDQ